MKINSFKIQPCLHLGLQKQEIRNTYHNRKNAFLGHCQTSNVCFDIQEHWRLLWDLKASICWLLLEIQQTLHKLNLYLDHKIRSLCQIVHCTAMINQKTEQTLLHWEVPL